MTNEEVAKCIAIINSSWGNKPLDRLGSRTWGTELVAHDYDAVIGVLRVLLRTEEWRPSLAKVLEAVRNGHRRRAIADAERPALAPAAPVSHEFLAELTAGIKESTRPTKLSNMIESEPRQACGRTGERRRWGALALDVLTDWLKEGNGAAADALDEVARRAAD